MQLLSCMLIPFQATIIPAYHFALQAEKSGLGASPRTLYRRHFRGQNLVVQEPLRLREGP